MRHGVHCSLKRKMSDYYSAACMSLMMTSVYIGVYIPKNPPSGFLLERAPAARRG
jgi:hypothetical protein